MRAFLLGLGILVTAMGRVGHGQEASLHVLARARIQWTGAEWREEGLVVSGRLIDEATGEGLAARKVQLRAQGPAGEEVQQATSDAQGAFRLKWRLPQGEYRLRAEFPGDTDCQAAAPQDWEVSERLAGPGRGPGEGQRSPAGPPERTGGASQEGAEAAAAAAASEGDPSEPEESAIPLTWYLAPPLFTSLLLLCVWFVRSAPWRRLRLSNERRAPAARRLVKKGGGAPGASPLLQNVRDGGLTGVVWDTVFDGPVAGAEIRVQALVEEGPGAQDERLLRSDAAGRFEAEALPPGAYALRVTALGYLDERRECTLPVRGPAEDVRVGMTPIRAVVFGLFHETVALPESPTWALGAQEEPPESEPEARTPRELAARAGAALTTTQGRSLAQLTLLVEETYFSSRIAAPEVVSEARHLAEQVKGAPQAPRTTT